MVRSIRRGAAAAVLALSLAPLAAACSAGNDAQTLQIEPDSQSAAVRDVKVQNAFVLTDPTGGPATITARLFNNGSSAQALRSVNVSGIGTATLHGANGGSTVTVPAHGSVLLGGKGNPSAVLDSASATPRNGDVQSTVFTFSRAGELKMYAMVLPATGYYASFGPSSTPTTSAPSPSTTPTGTAKPGSSTSPSSSPSASGSTS